MNIHDVEIDDTFNRVLNECNPPSLCYYILTTSQSQVFCFSAIQLFLLYEICSSSKFLEFASFLISAVRQLLCVASSQFAIADMEPINLLPCTFVSGNAGKKVPMEVGRYAGVGVISKFIYCCQIFDCLLLGCFMPKKLFIDGTPSELQIIPLQQTQLSKLSITV